MYQRNENTSLSSRVSFRWSLYLFIASILSSAETALDTSSLQFSQTGHISVLGVINLICGQQEYQIFLKDVSFTAVESEDLHISAYLSNNNCLLSAQGSKISPPVSLRVDAGCGSPYSSA